MSENERVEFRQKLREGLAQSRYKLIREKALRNENIIEGNYNGGTIEIPARQLLKELYGEEIYILPDDQTAQAN